MVEYPAASPYSKVRWHALWQGGVADCWAMRPDIHYLQLVGPVAVLQWLCSMLPSGGIIVGVVLLTFAKRTPPGCQGSQTGLHSILGGGHVPRGGQGVAHASQVPRMAPTLSEAVRGRLSGSV